MTPQIVNCPGSKIELSKEFAYDWFLNTIPLLKQHYDIKTQIPSFEKFEKDCKERFAIIARGIDVYILSN